jgi:lysozyme
MIPTRMHYDNEGMELTESFEGLSLTSYQDSKGVWTIGWGHTGKDIVEGLTWTRDQCEVALGNDIYFAVQVVNNLVTRQITQYQFDALVDFTFNCGPENFRKSTLLLLVNAGNNIGAEGEFDKWVRAGGKVLSGLVKRRAAESQFYMREGTRVVPPLTSVSV